MKLPLGRIAELLSATADVDRNQIVVGYSIDSRTIAQDELFFAIRGERFDGHNFVEAALKRGAAAAVIKWDALSRFTSKESLIAVDDPLLALQKLAACVRRIWGKPLIAVTGSAGKTTTKEAIAHLLATRYRVLKSEGNLNNHFGLPLQLLKLLPEHEVAVIEIGMSHSGEITALAEIAQPDIGVVTLVAPVHLEFFASIAEIARAKYELIAPLPANGIAVLNADDEYVSQFGRGFRGKVLTFGIQHPADVRAENVYEHGAAGSQFDLVIDGARERATLPLVGRHNIYNALAAVAVAMERGIKPSEAAAALGSLAPADKRGELLELAGATVINDCYNSNPRALNSMIDALATMPAKRRIVVAGEMLELGPAGEQLHRECGSHMAERGIDVVLGVRGLARHIAEAAAAAGCAAEFIDTPEQAGLWLRREVHAGDAVLLKASRGVRLENALAVWREGAQSAGQPSSPSTHVVRGTGRPTSRIRETKGE